MKFGYVRWSEEILYVGLVGSRDLMITLPCASKRTRLRCLLPEVSSLLVVTYLTAPTQLPNFVMSSTS